MPVWLAVGIALLIVGLAMGNGGLKGVVVLAGLLATAYGVGQYLRENRRG